MKKSTYALPASDLYRIDRHEQHARIQRIVLSEPAIAGILKICAYYTVQNLEYVPFARLEIARQLGEFMGEPFVLLLRNILHDRNTGCLTLGLQAHSSDADDLVRFATAVTHLIGIPNFDAMTGKYYARFVVQHTDNSDSYLRKAYRRMSLHTDGTYVDEVTDWLLMMKIDERYARGGRTRLLHLDDWKDLLKFSRHPLATHAFTYKAPQSKNVSQDVARQTFFDDGEGRPCLCFIDQFVYPDTREQAAYLHDLLKSMEDSSSTKHISLPPGEFVLLNNRFWVHGREAFEQNPELYRELMRLRGYFADT